MVAQSLAQSNVQGTEFAEIAIGGALSDLAEESSRSQLSSDAVCTAGGAAIVATGSSREPQGMTVGEIFALFEKHSMSCLCVLLVITFFMTIGVASANPHYFDGYDLPSVALAAREVSAWGYFAVGCSLAGVLIVLVARVEARWLGQVSEAIGLRGDARWCASPVAVHRCFATGGGLLAVVSWTAYYSFWRVGGSNPVHVGVTWCCSLALLLGFTGSAALTRRLGRAARLTGGSFGRSLQRSSYWKVRSTALLWLFASLHAGQDVVFKLVCSSIGGDVNAEPYSMSECLGELGLPFEYCQDHRDPNSASMTTLAEAKGCLGSAGLLVGRLTEYLALAALLLCFSVLRIDLGLNPADAPRPDSKAALVGQLSRHSLELLLLAQLESGRLAEKDVEAQLQLEEQGRARSSCFGSPGSSRRAGRIASLSGRVAPALSLARRSFHSARASFRSRRESDARDGASPEQPDPRRGPPPKLASLYSSCVSSRMSARTRNDLIMRALREGGSERSDRYDEPEPEPSARESRHSSFVRDRVSWCDEFTPPRRVSLPSRLVGTAWGQTASRREGEEGTEEPRSSVPVVSDTRGSGAPALGSSASL